MESRSQQWSKSCTSDRPVSWIGVFRYGRMARETLSLSKEPWGLVFPFTILFAVLTVSSARQLDWGYATEDSLCLTHYVWRNFWNMLEVKGGPPSVLSSSGVPYVWNRCWQMDINLDEVAWPDFWWYKMSQLVSLSAQARYTTRLMEWGHFMYLRMPQGYLASGNAYTRRYDEIIKNVPRKI